ncbi:Insulin-like growth factor 2 mRNA-binding protein 1 [Dirofilaria immitis]|nr:Insulin-like growth factor 2 mRNA-binding protein 1 [Dirofilaria immitis]
MVLRSAQQEVVFKELILFSTERLTGGTFEEILSLETSAIYKKMEHFANRSAQAQQHVYTTTPYNLYTNQPPYIAGYQTIPQHHPVTFQQGPSHYSRPSIGAGPVTNNVQQRQSGHEVGGNGINRSTGVHQSSVPSGSITHQSMHQSGTVSGDGSHSIAQSIAPLAASLTSHHCMPSSQLVINTSQPHSSQLNMCFQFKFQLYAMLFSFRLYFSLCKKDMPLRIVVDARYVGAIIGQGGSSIREITKESKARCVVDVQRVARDLTKNTEKVISILGQPEGCSKACTKILEVVRKEMEKDNTIAQHPDIELKIRAHNQLVGRLIGRGGATIKKIMEETGAHIYVSNEPTLARDAYALMPPYAASSLYGSDMSMHLERTVTVKASTMSIVSAAEQKISQKLRLSFEADVNSRIMFSSTSASATMPLITSMGEASYLNTTAGVPSTQYVRSTVGTTITGAGNTQQVRTVHMWVPNNMVGALIGAKYTTFLVLIYHAMYFSAVASLHVKGAHIRSAIRLTGAQLRIEGGGTNKDKKDNKREGSNDKIDKENISASELVNKEMTEANERIPSPKLSKDKDKDMHAEERLVTITGNDPQQYKAQFWIYQRIAEQSCHYMDEIRLCTEISVPSKLVGRIIGKGGQNVSSSILAEEHIRTENGEMVRELQRMTGAQVKIPDDAGDDEAQKVTIVRVLGNFQSSQAVQARLGQLINDFSQRLNIGSSNRAKCFQHSGYVQKLNIGSLPGPQQPQ